MSIDEENFFQLQTRNAEENYLNKSKNLDINVLHEYGKFMRNNLVFSVQTGKKHSTLLIPLLNKQFICLQFMQR